MSLKEENREYTITSPVVKTKAVLIATDGKEFDANTERKAAEKYQSQLDSIKKWREAVNFRPLEINIPASSEWFYYRGNQSSCFIFDWKGPDENIGELMMNLSIINTNDNISALRNKKGRMIYIEYVEPNYNGRDDLYAYLGLLYEVAQQAESDFNAIKALMNE